MSTGPNQPELGRLPIGWLIVSLESDRVNLGAVQQASNQTDQFGGVFERSKTNDFQAKSGAAIRQEKAAKALSALEFSCCLYVCPHRYPQIEGENLV